MVIMKEECHKLIIDDAFKRMCEPLSEKEYGELSMYIRNNGCSYPIQVWKRHVLTDFDVYEICHKYNIPFEINNLSFTSKEDAIFYTAIQLVKSKNINVVYQRYVIGAAYFAIKEILHNVSKGKRSNPFPHYFFETVNNSTKNINKSAVVTANAFSISVGSALDYSRFYNAINCLYIKAPYVAKDILRDEFHIGMRHVVILSQMPIDIIPMAYNKAKKESDYSLFQRQEKNDTQSVSLSFKTRAYIMHSGPEIKKMPKYDPDAELSSLSYTIPSWISSLNRTKNIADFSNSTADAQSKLFQTLMELINAALLLQHKLEEKHDE